MQHCVTSKYCIKKRVGSEVAVFLRTDVAKYDDLKALFALAESKFGGVDVSYFYTPRTYKN